MKQNSESKPGAGKKRARRPKVYAIKEEALPQVAEDNATLDYPDTRILSHKYEDGERQLTSFQKITLVDEGVTKAELERFKRRAGWDYDQLSDILGVARAKLIAKKGSEKFDKHVSEKIISLAELYSYGYEAFEDEGRFNSWIFSDNRALAGLAPFDYLDTQFGREEIMDLIGRIEYGIFS